VSAVAVPLVVVVDGLELALGPREAALVSAVLAVAAATRGERAYKVALHVKGGSVVVEVTRHVGTVAYCSSAPD
jgi:hypothetical protein